MSAIIIPLQTRILQSREVRSLGQDHKTGEELNDLRIHPLARIIIFSASKLLETTLPDTLCGTSSARFSCSVVSTLCDAVDCSTPGLPVHHQLPEPSQTHVNQAGDVIQPSHPSPPAFNLSHQGLFQSASSLNQVAKVLEFQLQHQSFQ